MTPTESDLFDMFLDWLERPMEDYSRHEIETLWNEFYEKYPEGIERWGEEENEDF